MSQTPLPKIEYLSLRRQHNELADELYDSINRVLISDETTARKTVQDFEEKLAGYCGVAHAVAVNSGTDALTIALSVLDIPLGSEIVTSAFGFFSTVAAIIKAGFKPVLVDIDANTFNIDPHIIEAAISDTTKAILPVHLFGRVADLNKLTSIAKKYSLVVVEDAAQSLGAKINGVPVGSVGQICGLSFNWSKNLATLSNGGAVITNDNELAKEAEVMRNYGMSASFYHTRLGLNSRLDPLEAALLLVKLQYLDNFNARRIEIAKKYDSLLTKISSVKTPSLGPHSSHVFHKYAILADRRDALKDYLLKRGVETMVFYPAPLHRQPCFVDHIRIGSNCLEVSELVVNNILCLPIYPELTTDEIEYVAECIAAFYANSP
jgi:dTDP-4-amino-4,6-dideoxygalactose transaminase